jgi:hypothetical protein
MQLKRLVQVPLARQHEAFSFVRYEMSVIAARRKETKCKSIVAEKRPSGNVLLTVTAEGGQSVDVAIEPFDLRDLASHLIDVAVLSEETPSIFRLWAWTPEEGASEIR